MTRSVIKKRLEELMEPCRHCKSALIHFREPPCVSCVHGNKDVGVDYFKKHNWVTFMQPPLPEELIDMRVDSLEFEVVELRRTVEALKEAVDYLTRRQTQTLDAWPKADLDKRLRRRKP